MVVVVVIGTSVTRLGDLLNFGQLLKPLAVINLPKSPKFLGNFCKGVKIYHFSSEIIFGQLFKYIWWFFSGHTGRHVHKKKKNILARRVCIDWNEFEWTAVWPDLAKFRLLGKLSKILGKLLRVYFVFGIILHLLWHLLYFWGKFGLLWVTKKWKII